MSTITKYPEPLVFGLDIGTRSIVGMVGYKEQNKFNVVAMCVKYHDTRSMIDGQIHDIAKVSEDILFVKNELENQLGGRKLTEVCIAAAGRVLKTAVGHGEYEFNENTTITQELIHSIDLIGIEKAHEMILKELSENSETTKYYCVGYTVMRYFLNDYEITNLEGHKGKKIAADVLATFLPEEVVSSLYAAVEQAGLLVSNLTLEPIAAINVAIPESYRLLNIALVDVGAGTSDICITKDGSIIGYGMIPSAGDELTEAIIKKYLVDFDTAEKIKTSSVKRKMITYKDIMGISHKLSAEEIAQTLDGVKKEITKKISDKILELNGGESVSAVFVVGGGGKLAGFTEMIAKSLKLPNERVAIRGQEVMNDINFLVEDVKKDSLYVTPVGICLSYFDQKNNFIFVNVNGSRIKLYNNDKLTIFDAAVQFGLPKEKLFPRRGEDLTFTVNGKTRIVRGNSGEAAVIELNGEQVGMNSLIEANDKVMITESTIGSPAKAVLSSLPEYEGYLTFRVNNNEITCSKFALVNGKVENQFYEIQNGDTIEMLNYYTLSQLFEYMDVQPESKVFVNNMEADENTKIYDNFVVTWSIDLKYENLSEPDEEELSLMEEKKKEKKLKQAESENEKKEELEDDVNNQQVLEKHDITVIVNKKAITMHGKSSYVFVDIFDYINFDLSKVQGTRLVTTVNGEQAEYVQPIFDGNIIEVYWET